jgi:hypothetical protein
MYFLIPKESETPSPNSKNRKMNRKMKTCKKNWVGAAQFAIKLMEKIKIVGFKAWHTS